MSDLSESTNQLSLEDRGPSGQRHSPPSVAEEIDEDCCCPIGCSAHGEPIDPESWDELVVRVVCSNLRCSFRPFMHKPCFDRWEREIVAHLRCTGRVRNWTDKQLLQHLWQKRAFDLDFTACACKCGHGYLRKDLAATPVKVESDKKRRRKKSGVGCASGKQILTSCLSSTGDGDNNSNHDDNNYSGPRMRSRTLSLGSAAGIAHPPPLLSRNLARRQQFVSESDFFNDEQVQSTGSIFRHRESMTSLFACLPQWKRNGIHIKMEDDCPQGNDETRIFLLTTLGDKKLREVRCVLCHRCVPIFDRYPLIDGTFFMSPANHGKLGIKVKHEGRDAFLLAACVWCLEGAPRLTCSRCQADNWFPGDRLVLGTLYSYDVLSSGACRCAPPTCVACRQPAAAASSHAATERHASYSLPSAATACAMCGHVDTHWLRKLDTIERAAMAVGKA